jgi:hypothetical protein
MIIDKKTINETIEVLEMMYCTVRKYTDTTEFLFGIELADNMEMDRFSEALAENNLRVSIQDNWIKIPSANFTTKEDLQHLVNCFRLCVSF